MRGFGAVYAGDENEADENYGRSDHGLKSSVLLPR
jgi:hypothetical protein